MSQCSLHPTVVYICSSDNLVESSLCILSEDLNHDVAFAYKVIKETVAFIKKKLNPSVKTIRCFHLQLVPIKKSWLSHSIPILTVFVRLTCSWMLKDTRTNISSNKVEMILPQISIS